MQLKSLEISGFKSFAKKESLPFEATISAIVGPNGSGKSNVAEAFRFVLGEQSIKSMRGKRGEDLIFNGTQKITRQNKASVKITFDNSKRLLNIDFDEVTLERVVHRDGQNEYFINTSKVRLKDIHELLAGANIGSTGHHIISQGEADRILNASSADRKEMFEDALGLRLYQYRKVESERKLEKTAEHIKEVESLRREIAPHVRFLKKQVEKIEKTIQLQKELEHKYQEYLSKEYTYISHKKKEVEQLPTLQRQLTELNEQIERFSKNSMKDTSKEEEFRRAILDIKQRISDMQQEENEIRSMVAGMEGQIRTLTDVQESSKKSGQENISFKRTELEGKIQELKKMQNESLESVKSYVAGLVSYFEGVLHTNEPTEEYVLDIDFKVAQLRTDIEQQQKKMREKRDQIIAEQEALREAERALAVETAPVSNVQIIRLMNDKTELTQKFSNMQYQQRELEQAEEEFNREVQEAIVLAGRSVAEHAARENTVVLEENRTEQKERRKELERIKIRVEETGILGGDDVMKEFQEVTERDEFLKKELEDLRGASADLQKVIDQLNTEIHERFKEGLTKINAQFSKFFSVMFDGGNAELRVEKKKTSDTGEEDENAQEGLEIDVNLPRKKVSGLMMLSGGERALTSIALLFAMSSVNPPPFIILDETDAALDEANSKRYGDMIVNLAKHSQLILITHNRETMSRAGVIFGITMIDGASKVLSIKFDEAVLMAK